MSGPRVEIRRLADFVLFEAKIGRIDEDPVSEVIDYCRRLAARVEELEKLATEFGWEEAEGPLRLAAALTENNRLRESATTSIRKCEQYWNEHNIPDAEIHAALELIHGALSIALKEKK